MPNILPLTQNREQNSLQTKPKNGPKNFTFSIQNPGNPSQNPLNPLDLGSNPSNSLNLASNSSNSLNLASNSLNLVPNPSNSLNLVPNPSNSLNLFPNSLNLAPNSFNLIQNPLSPLNSIPSGSISNFFLPIHTPKTFDRQSALACYKKIQIADSLGQGVVGERAVSEEREEDDGEGDKAAKRKRDDESQRAKHSNREKRRRMELNDAIDRLKSFVPKTEKSNGAKAGTKVAILNCAADYIEKLESHVKALEVEKLQLEEELSKFYQNQPFPPQDQKPQKLISNQQPLPQNNQIETSLLLQFQAQLAMAYQAHLSQMNLPPVVPLMTINPALSGNPTNTLKSLIGQPKNQAGIDSVNNENSHKDTFSNKVNQTILESNPSDEPPNEIITSNPSQTTESLSSLGPFMDTIPNSNTSLNPHSPTLCTDTINAGGPAIDFQSSLASITAQVKELESTFTTQNKIPAPSSDQN